MLKTAMIHARVEPTLKQDAEIMLRSVGLNMSQAITLFLQQVKFQRGLPFDVKVPNEETQKIMQDVIKGYNIEDFSFDELK
jgi:DNA-damage-inducible protein J